MVNGTRCHGGFSAEGKYQSPRMLNRGPAIDAWRSARQEDFQTPLLDIALSSWPGAYPNVAQAKYLLSEAVRQPLIASLTRIGTIEGFGAMLRYSPVPELSTSFDDDVRGTAMAHLTGGLFEAHARDEAGFEDEGGHKQMWFAARDMAFENPVTVEQTEVLLRRMGITGGYAGPSGGSAAPDPAAIRRQQMQARMLTDTDIDVDLEMLIMRMARLL